MNLHRLRTSFRPMMDLRTTWCLDSKTSASFRIPCPSICRRKPRIKTMLSFSRVSVRLRPRPLELDWIRTHRLYGKIRKVTFLDSLWRSDALRRISTCVTTWEDCLLPELSQESTRRLPAIVARRHLLQILLARQERLQSTGFKMQNRMSRSKSRVS